MKIYLVRHAQKSGTFVRNSRKKVGLTPVGKLQAAAFGKYAKKLNIKKVYCSPFRRTFKTAKIIGSKLGQKPIKTERIKEIPVTTYIMAIIKSLFLIQQSQNGILETLKKFPTEGGNVLLVSHAGFIRLTASLLSKSWIQRLKYLIRPYHNTGLTIIEIDKNKNLEIIEYNKSHFLPDSIKSFLPV